VYLSPGSHAEAILAELPHPILFSLGSFAYLLALPIFVISLLSHKLFRPSDKEPKSTTACYTFAYTFISLSLVAWLGGSLDSSSFALSILFGFFLGWIEGTFRSSRIPHWIEEDDLTIEARIELLRHQNNTLQNSIFLYLGLVAGAGVSIGWFLQQIYERSDIGLVMCFFVLSFFLMVMALLQGKSVIREKLTELYKQKQEAESLMRSKIEELLAHMQARDEKDNSQEK